MNKYNTADFLSGLAPIDWMQIFSDLNFDPNRMTDAFHEIFESALNFRLNPTRKALMRERDKKSSWH